MKITTQVLTQLLENLDYEPISFAPLGYEGREYVAAVLPDENVAGFVSNMMLEAFYIWEQGEGIDIKDTMSKVRDMLKRSRFGNKDGQMVVFFLDYEVKGDGT